VNQAVDVVREPDEGAEAGEFGDLAGDEVADLVELVDLAHGSSTAVSCRSRSAG
jgi:hypothetical protein